ncbi:MAG: phosphate butyryltransferase [Spirochaetae bacterium HGW-Spirochaetae-2]|jgi:phosphate butyryltransferase|nr:MAG: phosphate butyryltransferase [Spirochaetae bacterium HGW-Spirochaetae-2]
MSESKKTVALVGSAHNESLRAMQAFQTEHDAEFLLIGNTKETREKAQALGIDIEGLRIIDASDDIEACKLAAHAAMDGSVHVLMKGSVHTADFLRAILDKEYGLLPEGSLLSHVARLVLPWYHKQLLLTDAAVSIVPDLDKKVQIIANAIAVAHNIGIPQPKIALVCPVETVNPRIVSTTDASQIVFLQKNTAVFEDAVIEGPFGLDVALSVQAARVKGIEGEVPGDADILVFGNIDAANATFKAFLSAPDVVSAGIVVGAKLPVVLTSRSESMHTRIESINMALTVSG